MTWWRRLRWWLGNVLAPDYCGFNPYTDDVAPDCPLPEETPR
jgi:hypothetical protein